MALHAVSNRPKDECGVCGIINHPDAARLTYFGLYALQHRGQESTGIVAFDGSSITEHKAMGLVPEVYTETDLNRLSGKMALGHVRYSTTGASNAVNAQPFTATHRGKTVSVAHNGNLVNTRQLRDELESKGAIFQSTMDSEVVLHLLAHSACDNTFEHSVVRAFKKVKGAYSLILMTKDKMIAIRDPNGFRPLCLGKLNNGGYIIASETCALDLVEADYVRDIEPGEILVIEKDGMRTISEKNSTTPSFCIFEHIYFARPDSEIFGLNVYKSRKKMGEILARETDIDADFIMPFPDSGNYAAIGYSQASGIPMEMGVIRNHYVGRTFIQPTQSMRDFSVRVKLNPVRSLLENKKVIIMEDSIIRGTTGRSRVRALRKAGVKEIHMVISCPPHRYPCYYGIDFPCPEQLIAARNSIDDIRDSLGLDSLYYLSTEGLIESTGMPRENFCLACFNNEYPVPPDPNFHKHAFCNN